MTDIGATSGTGTCGDGRPREDAPGEVRLIPITGVGEVSTGDDLGSLLTSAMDRVGLHLQDGDILVASSKIVSKAAGLRRKVPSDDPQLAAAAKAALVREHTRRVVAERAGVNGITRVVHAAAGPVMAAAGIDASNTGPDGGLLILPDDPDAAAAHLAAGLAAAGGAKDRRFGVILSDTAGRPWRLGQSDFAIGAWGVDVLDDLRGASDGDGRGLSVTARAVADQLASAADLVKGKVGGIAAALVRGLPDLVTGRVGDPAASPHRAGAGAAVLVRTGPDDWFAQGRVEAVRSALGVHPGGAVAERVGIPSLHPETLEVRIGRAIAMACLDDGTDPAMTQIEDQPSPVQVRLSPAGAGEDGSPRIEVASTDAYLRGLITARLRVALVAEALAGPLLTGVSTPVRVQPISDLEPDPEREPEEPAPGTAESALAQPESSASDR